MQKRNTIPSNFYISSSPLAPAFLHHRIPKNSGFCYLFQLMLPASGVLGRSPGRSGVMLFAWPADAIPSKELSSFTSNEWHRFRGSSNNDMLDLDTDLDVVARFERVSRYGAFVVGMLGVIVLIGWGLDIAVLKSILPGWVTMKANTALGFLLSGIALAMSHRSPPTDGWRWVRLGLSSSVPVIGLLTLGEYVLGIDFAIDQLLFSTSNESPPGSAPGRMAPATAIGFAFTGLALACLVCRRYFPVTQFAALVGILIGTLAVLGYAYGVGSLYGVGAYSSVALHTAAGFVVINVAILLSRPRRGLCAILTRNSAGGMMARRLLPLAFISPFAIGWVQVISEDTQLVNARFGVALASLAYLVIFSTVIWRTARMLHHSDLVRITVQDAQKKHQAQLAGVIDSAMDGIIMVDDEQRITLFNPAAEKMFVRSATDVLGGPLDILIPSHYRERHAGHFRAFGSTGETNRRMGGLGTVTGLRASGEEFPIEASISRLEANGAKLSTVILRDVSDRCRFEQALAKSRGQQTAMIEQAPISIAMFDRNMCYLAASSRWVDEYGGDREDLRGKSLYDVLPDISDDWKKVHRDGLAGITTKNDSDLWIKSDGARKWLRWAVHPWVDEDGSIGGIIISAEDITPYKRIELALRASEDDLNRAQAVGNIGSWRLDVLRNELTWSNENYRIFGIPEGTPLTYETFLARVHPDDREFVDRMWKAALATPGTPYDIEHRVVADGRIKWVREKAELEFDANGCLLGGFGITQDITARRRAEEQIKQANDRLAAVAADRAASLQELSSALTDAEQRERDRLYELLHDHVQPLLVAARLGLSGLGPHTPRQEILSVVTEAKAHISSVIQTARTLSVELNPPLIREQGLIPALKSLSRSVQTNYGLAVDLACAEGTEPGNMTIRLLCFKAVRELLMNVVKYAGTHHVTLNLQRQGHDTLQVTVCDEGVGFDPVSYQEGSGLANIERRLGMVGGRLLIESAPGMGTTAILLMPLDLRPNDRTAESESRLNGFRGEEDSGGGTIDSTIT